MTDENNATLNDGSGDDNMDLFSSIKAAETEELSDESTADDVTDDKAVDGDTETEEGTAEESDDATDASGDDDQAEKQSDEDDQAASEDEVSEDSDTGPVAPEHWPARDRARFDKLPKDGREFILERHKSMEADHTKKSMELSDLKKAIDPIEGVLAQHRPYYNAQGLDDAAQLRTMFAVQQALNTKPVQTLVQLAAQYGFTAEQLAQAAQGQPQVDPAIAQVQQQNFQIQQQIAGERQERLQAELTRFATERSPDGKLMRPHFEEVRGTMAQLFQAGMVTDYPTAYAKAVQFSGLTTPPSPANPKPPPMRKPSSDPQRIAKAKRASTGVRSAATGTSKPVELGDIIDAQLNAEDL